MILDKAAAGVQFLIHELEGALLQFLPSKKSFSVGFSFWSMVFESSMPVIVSEA